MSSFLFHGFGNRRFAGVLIALAVLLGPGGSQHVRADDTVHAGRIEKVVFRSQHFEIVGNLYLPTAGKSPHPLVIWVSGSGPSIRTVKNAETIKLVNCFLDRGVAYFRIDKPGSGDSKGVLHDDSLFAQLSRIVVDAVGTLKKHRQIDPTRIGLFGSSQAGYIMPLAISRCKDIAFMIGSSCPGENSIKQWNYLLEMQMLCEGTPPEKAQTSVEMFNLLRCTTEKATFDSAREYFVKNPMILRSLGYDSSFAEKARSWWPRMIDLNDESHFDPVVLIEKIHIPLYLVYGGRDRQINPEQAMFAYRDACLKAGNKRIRIVLLPLSDHNMSLSDGCLSDIESLNKSNNYKLDPAYLETIKGWVGELVGGGHDRRKAN